MKPPEFKSCEELRAHGVEMDGYYSIGGAETYCKSSWSKSFVVLPSGFDVCYINLYYEIEMLTYLLDYFRCRLWPRF